MVRVSVSGEIRKMRIYGYWTTGQHKQTTSGEETPGTLNPEILVSRVLWRFENREKVENSKNSKNPWNTFVISNLLSLFVILTPGIHGIPYNQSGYETKGLILVFGGRLGH